jgi:hypothetical protein
MTLLRRADAFTSSHFKKFWSTIREFNLVSELTPQCVWCHKKFASWAAAKCHCKKCAHRVELELANKKREVTA